MGYLSLILTIADLVAKYGPTVLKDFQAILDALKKPKTAAAAGAECSAEEHALECLRAMCEKG